MRKYRNKDEEVLDKGLFQVDKLKKNKGKSYLNPDLLPVLFNYLKDCMSPLEKSCLYDYEFQNYLIEISLLRNKKGMQNNIFYLKEYINYEIQHNPKYWIINSEMHVKIKKEFPPPEEEENKIDNSKQNNESVEEYRNYLSKIQKIKEKYVFKVPPEEKTNNPEVLNPASQMALETDLTQPPPGLQPEGEREQKPANGNYAQEQEEDEEQSSYEEVMNVEEDEDEDYLLRPRFKPTRYNNMGYPSQSTLKIYSSNRVTRQTRRKIKDENPSLSGHEYYNLMRARREKEMDRQITVSNGNSYRRFAKIEFQLFPFVYQFVTRNQTLDEKGVYAVQNFVLFLLLSDTPCKRKSRLRPDYLLREFSTEGSEEIDIDKESKDFSLEEKPADLPAANQNDEGVELEKKIDGCESNKTLQSSDETVHTGFQNNARSYAPISSFPAKAYIYENQTMTSFNYFCLQEGIKLEALLASDADYGKKQRILLINSLDMLMEHAKTWAQGSSVKIKEKNINNDSEWEKLEEEKKEFCKQLLFYPENYKKCTSMDIKMAVRYYKDNVENKKFTNYDTETFYQYIKLTESSRPNNKVKRPRGDFDEEPFIATTADRSYIDSVIHSYIVLMNGEEMKQKRSYMFHNDDRMEWSEAMYKSFLQGLQKYFDITINNKKIAKHIGGTVTSNHVKYVKGKYLRKLKKRARERKIVPKLLLQEDIDNFDINLFKNL